MSLLFEQINDNLSSRPTYLESYKKVSQYVYNHYVTFPDSFGSLSLLITFIISDLIELKLSEKYLLCQRIRDSSKSDNDISMNVASHCLLLSRKNVSQKGLILIEEPSFILPVLLIGESLKNSLTFYKNLCDYSSTNCYQFHKGRLDLFLLEVIKVFQKGDTLQFDDNSFKIDFGEDFVDDLIFPMLSHIMNFGCNFETLQKVTEINMTAESKYGDQLLNLITMTLCEKQRISKITHIFCKESKALTFDLTTDFSCGFSFSCWVFFDKVYSEVSCSQCTIFSLIFSEGYGDGISCFLSGTSLHAILFSRFGTSSSSIVLCPNFPSNQWTLITLSVRPRGDENAQIGFSINAEKSLAFLVRDAISKGSSNVRIGGMRKLNTKKSKIIANTLCKLGPFRLVQYSKQIKQEMVEMYSRPESMNGDLIPLSNIEEIEDKESVLSVVRSKKFLSDCLLKLFSLSEKRNGEFIVRLLDILRFSDFKNSQELIRCFSSYLSQSAKILPFRVFSCCSDIYESTKDVNFLCRVVFNLELWLETSQTICSRCLQQLTAVSQNFASIVFSFYNFRFLLSVFRKSVENKEKDFASCQKILFNCVQFKGLTDSDSISLAGHIAMSCLEGREKLTIFFLQTLQGICDFISDKILFKITSILSKTFKESKSVASSFYVISVLTMILEKRIGNDVKTDNDDDESIFDAEDCLFLLQSSLAFPDDQFGKELNDKLLENCQDQPLLIHFILKISSILEIKPDFSVFYEKNFSFSDKATKVNFWPLWATKYASLFSEEGSNLIFRLFISKPSQNLSDLILTFFSFYGLPGHKGLSVFVQLCSKHLTSSHDRQLISSIVSRTASILCLSRDSHSYQILSLFENSEFKQTLAKQETDKLNTEDEIFGCLKKGLCLRSPSPPFSSLVISLNSSFQAIPAQLAEFCRFSLALHTKGGISASRSLCGCAQSVYSYSMNDYNAHCLPKVNKLFQRYTKIINESSLIKDGILKATHDIIRLDEFDRNENILASNTLKDYGLSLVQSQ
ncbi:hypothetical protein TVAG_443730 [Trichomonas vaginalis G3]|uniref:Uncharacterized protein n=1 Tax=Trichomonas vaginalis (strain ATCC PRA-98 / G3) TaxID=412133 RepID=A2ETZ7_TRIV3|nr:aggrephagy protein [Trichomonas vaginalis G3]EAY03885.1 hypothetical protein TVAG_443730 [Trichomonas vaginalis G3]KAI5552937.1 aggrephagy protein [Trichomonas vaginalis G3]|eukprot:XP_001316108.1 hypothetical protein [Trichomonas vaginalis G3]